MTTDRDLGDDKSYPGIAAGQWIAVGKARVQYVDSSSLSLAAIRRLVDEVRPDRIYLNSFFDKRFTLRLFMIRLFWQARIPGLIVAPRGEFSEGALALHSMRKRLYLWAFRLLNLHKSVTWHASTLLEARDIEREMPRGADIRVATDLGAAPPQDVASRWTSRAAGSPLRICFLSRISPMKNLTGALKILRHVRSRVAFDVFGPKEDESYWGQCAELVKSLPPHVTVSYAGVVPHEEAAATIAQYDLFLFPTLGENFGHVIVESLSAGVPVLTSDRTPWNDLEQEGVGWSISGSEADYAARIDAVANLAPGERDRMRARCAAYANGVLTSRNALAHNVALFE